MSLLSFLSATFTPRVFLLITWNCTSALFVIWIVSTALRKFLGLRVIGLTGSISTGKSTCTKFFENHRLFTIIDFDSITHDVYACGRPAWTKIRKEFGDNILNPNWTINRIKLGEIVWNDRNKLNKLMKITSIPILKDFIFELFLNIFYGRGHILDIPLLCEQKYIMYLLCDEVLLIYCNKNEQIKRLMNRDNINQQQALLKISKQMDIDNKKKYANTIIDNSNDLYSTQCQLEDYIKQYKTDKDTVNNGTCLWKQAIKPTKLSFILSTLLCVAAFGMHKLVTFEFF